MKRNRALFALILALTVLMGVLPALAEVSPQSLLGGWKLATWEAECRQGSYSHALDISGTIDFFDGVGTHLTFHKDGTLDTDIDMPAIVAEAPEVPFDIPPVDVGGDSWTLSGETLTLTPSQYEYEVRFEDGLLILEYSGVTQARNDGNPSHFKDGEGDLTVTIGLAPLDGQAVEAPVEEEPEPAEEPTPEPTEEPTPEPTPEPTEEPTPEPTEAPEPNLSAYAPGLSRTGRGMRPYDTAQRVAERYGVALTDGAPLYTPAHPQPLNAYMVTREDCDVGINRDDMYKVSEKGLVESITKYLTEWCDEIANESGHTIRFVDDPDDADVLVVACQTYEYYGLYGSGTYTCSAYSSRLTLRAVQLTNPQNATEFSAVNEPGSTITTNGGSKFWKYPPEIEDTQNLKGFVSDIRNWYGASFKGTGGAGVKAAQQALIDRGFLEGSADGSFGPKTEEAVMRLQAAYGLEQTGIISGKTLVALYFDQAAVDAAD